VASEAQRILLPPYQLLESLGCETRLPLIAATVLGYVRRLAGAEVAWLVLGDDAGLVERSGRTGLDPGRLRALALFLVARGGARPPRAGAAPGSPPAILARRARPLAAPRVFTPEGVRALAGATGEDYAAAMAGEGWQEVLVLPVAVRARRIGVICAAALRPFSRDAGLRYGLVIAAAQTAVAVEHALQYTRLRRQSLTDALTGLPNARSLRDLLPAMVAGASRAGRHLSLVFLDSDSLKEINDRFGHAAGDRFVVDLVVAMRDGAAGVRGLRRGDVLVRYAGGDEFIVLLPDTGAGEALVVAERLRRAIDRPIRVEDHTLRRTASLGTATYPEDARTPEDLLRCADLAMYEAKRRGKNRVVAYGEIGSRRSA
jgi:diguanylate cyclase (GGDEF)-like protein